jgi:transcriptional regulator with XRE-family HTH domain
VEEGNDVGRLIRAWRELRACSQRELADRTGLSSRHLSFIETGRAAPSRDAVLWIAQALAIPHPETGLLLEAAGFVAPYATPAPGQPTLDRRAELQRVLDILDPRPAMIHDVYGTMHAYNRAFGAVLGSLVTLEDYAGEHGGLRMMTELRPIIDGWEQLMELYIRRLHDELLRAKGAAKVQLQAQLTRMAGAVPAELIAAALDRRGELGVLLPLDIQMAAGVLRLEATTLTMGTPIHVGVRELRVMLFAPRDVESADHLVRLVAAAR